MRSMTRVEYLRASNLNPNYKGEASRQHAHRIGGLHSKHETVLVMRKTRVLGRRSQYKAVDPRSVVGRR